MFGIKRRRTLIRVLSYTVSAFCLAVIVGISGFVMAYKYRMGIEYGYQRALTELTEHVGNIDIALQKAQYASTSAQLTGLSGEIWANAGSAQTDIAQMPLSTVKLSNTTKFLSQAGDYANSLTRQLNTDQPITAEQRNTITTLHSYAQKLSTQLSDMSSDLQAGRISLFKAEKVASRNKPNQATPTSLQGGFINIENTFASLPSMIYDGPFSDNVLKKEPVFTQGKPAVSKEDAHKIAAKFLDKDVSSLKDAGETDGTLPSWNFNTGDTSIFISKAGGYVVRMLANRAPTQPKLDTAAASQKAEAFLQSRGISSVVETYYLTNNNICTINFAYQQNGVVVYPDLVKVGIALDTGEIVSFDSTGYLMNHHTRDLPAVKFTKAQIQAKVNASLTVQKVTMAIIPTSGSSEAYCYEFRTVSKDNQQVIDYFNTQTGAEQQVLILKATPGGMLAM